MDLRHIFQNPDTDAAQAAFEALPEDDMAHLQKALAHHQGLSAEHPGKVSPSDKLLQIPTETQLMTQQVVQRNTLANMPKPSFDNTLPQEPELMPAPDSEPPVPKAPKKAKVPDQLGAPVSNATESGTMVPPSISEGL